jgi:hypothetical protein
MSNASDHLSSHVTAHYNESIDAGQFSLTLAEALLLLEQAGVPRNEASIARFCRTGKLKAVLRETSNTRKYFINEASLQALINELKSKKKRDNSDIYHHNSSHVVTNDDQSQEVQKNGTAHHASSPVITRDDATQLTPQDKDKSAPIITREDSLTEMLQQQFEFRIKDKDDIITILKSQLDIKDDQIKQLTENMLAESKQGRGLADKIGGLFQKYLLGREGDLPQPPMSN